jgi:hypothetical protein
VSTVQRLHLIAVLGVVFALFVGCTSLAPPRLNPSPGQSASFAPSASPRAVLLPVPANYEEACRLEPQVCVEGSGAIPAQLFRPLNLPTLQPGQPCPTSAGVRMKTTAFGGVALGSGLVRPLITAEGDPLHGVARLDMPSGAWYGFKTLWFSDPSYQGPWIVRGTGLGHNGLVAFGEQPAVSELVVPPGDTLNEKDGWRMAPGGAWVSGPGCYGWQVDGIGFSTVIVFDAVVN